ncbi:MAG: hypothetical protein FWH27_16560 [Planctomycetaceae bacterium]|nr:hypothetical protein [Planctomycetaceae bacterium]
MKKFPSVQELVGKFEGTTFDARELDQIETISQEFRQQLIQHVLEAGSGMMWRFPAMHTSRHEARPKPVSPPSQPAQKMTKKSPIQRKFFTPFRERLEKFRHFVVKKNYRECGVLLCHHRST